MLQNQPNFVTKAKKLAYQKADVVLVGKEHYLHLACLLKKQL